MSGHTSVTPGFAAVVDALTRTDPATLYEEVPRDWKGYPLGPADRALVTSSHRIHHAAAAATLKAQVEQAKAEYAAAAERLALLKELHALLEKYYDPATGETISEGIARMEATDQARAEELLVRLGFLLPAA
ncbi:MAG: hypothetical protein QM655_12655 [Nocardioidaceae bacterium]